MGVAGKLISTFPETLVFFALRRFRFTYHSTKICTIGEKCVENLNKFNPTKRQLLWDVSYKLIQRPQTSNYNCNPIMDMHQPLHSVQWCIDKTVSFSEIPWIKEEIIHFLFIVPLLISFFCADDLISYEIGFVSSTKRLRRTVREPVHAHRSNSRSHA